MTDTTTTRVDAPSEAQERQLVADLQRGEERAFEELIRIYGRRLLMVARRFLPDESDANDAFQDALLSAVRSIGTYSGEARLGTWLHRIVVNAALMKLRTRRRHPEQSIETLLPRWQDDGHPAEWPAEWRTTSADEAAATETRALIRKKIMELPEAFRTVLLLRDIEELDTAETARLLEISENAVKTRLHRARLALRTLVDPLLRREDV